MTLGPVKRALVEGHRVEAIKTLKANGENCQVSYVSEIDAWVISSKNVGLVARTIEDVDLYQKRNSLRYSFSSMMARCWFNTIASFKKKDLQTLKQDFTEHTFIGEFVGNEGC